MALNLVGTWVFRFSGYDRDLVSNDPRSIIGMGFVELKANGSIDGRQHATNVQISGSADMPRRLRHSNWLLEGSYTVNHAAPPLRGEIDVTFTRLAGGNPSDKTSMTDTFKIVQAGPAQLWLLSKRPRDQAGNDLDEAVIGEATKVDSSTW